jgi:hypothetical protein
VARLEDVTRGSSVRGVLPAGLVTVVDVKWHGSSVLEVTYKDQAGKLGNKLLYRDREPTLEVVQAGQFLSFNADGALFRLVSEANCIRLAYLFDPLFLVHYILGRIPATPNHRRLRGDDPPAAVSVPPRRRFRVVKEKQIAPGGPRTFCHLDKSGRVESFRFLKLKGFGFEEE